MIKNIYVLLLSIFFVILGKSLHAEVKAPDFKLLNLEGKKISLSDYRNKIVVLEWFNYGCPFVKKHYESGNMQKLQQEYTKKGIIWLTIVSSAKGKQGNYPAEEHRKILTDWKTAPTQFLIDESGEIGRAYNAKTTPHLFIIGKEGNFVYQGAIDSERSVDVEDIPKATNYVKNALDEILKGNKVTVANTTPYGCSVKY
jgi:peroxiredoxin